MLLLENCLKSCFQHHGNCRVHQKIRLIFQQARNLHSFALLQGVGTASIASCSHVEMPVIDDLRQLDGEESESKPTTGREHCRKFSKLSSEQTHTMFIAQLSWFKFVLLFSATLEKNSPGRSCPTLYNLAKAGWWQLKLAALNELGASRRKRWAWWL